MPDKGSIFRYGIGIIWLSLSKKDRKSRIGCLSNLFRDKIGEKKHEE